MSTSPPNTNSVKELLIIGVGVTAESVYRFVSYHKLFNVIGFAVDKKYKTLNTFCDLTVYCIEELDSLFDKRNYLIFVAIQWNRLNKDRRDVYDRLKSKGFHFANIISPTAIVYGQLHGSNCWISDLVILDTDSHIGENVFIKSKAYIAHYATIKDHCFIGANSFIAGGVEIGEQSFVGVCATIFDLVKIGNMCLIGASTVVKRNIDDYTIVKTNNKLNLIIQSTKDDIENKLLASNNIR